MRTTLFLSLLLTSIYEVSAVENTSPFLAWSPQKFNTQNELNSAVVSVQDLQNGIYDLVDCSRKAILVVDEPLLHASDLGRSGRNSLKAQIQGAESSLQIPFVNGAVDLASLAEELAQKCHTPFVDANVGDDVIGNVAEPSVFYLRMAGDSVKKNDEDLGKVMAEVQEQFHNDFLVLYSTSQAKDFPSKHHLGARQDAPQPPPTYQSGIFHNYTFFSQGIFMGLLVAVLVVPIAIVGIFWNLSVQQPQRFEKKQN